MATSFKSTWDDRGRGYIRSTYRADEIDALGAYCGTLDRCYLLPVAMVAGKHALNLRTSAARNNQRVAINFAADYELGAVAQLAERRYGIPEAEGSSPSSSTLNSGKATALRFPCKDGFSDLDEAVGMDQFYAKLAQYVRRAEAGDDTLVTRWGKPVARLGPATLK